MNYPENQQFFFLNPVGGGGSFRGSKNQKSGKFHELPRKSIIFLTPSEDGEGGVDGTGREREAGREGGARAKPGNQLVVNKMCA